MDKDNTKTQGFNAYGPEDFVYRFEDHLNHRQDYWRGDSPSEDDVIGEYLGCYSYNMCLQEYVFSSEELEVLRIVYRAYDKNMSQLRRDIETGLNPLIEGFPSMDEDEEEDDEV